MRTRPWFEARSVNRHKDARTILVRTLFGTLRLPSPRWHRCGCAPTSDRTFSPLAALLPERTTPELAYLETKFAGLVSYGLSARLLGEVLPLGRRLHAAEVRRRTHAVADRLEDELGPEPASSIVVGPMPEDLARPDLPWWSASTAGSSTPPTSAPGGTAGSR
jgi:hypothetical protein